MFWKLILILLPAIILFLLLLALAWAFSTAFVRNSIFSVFRDDSSMSHMLEPFAHRIESGKEFLRTREHTRVYTKSHDGLTLSASYYPNNSNRTLIAFHGYRSTPQRDFSCAVKMYLDMGLNVLLVDHRSHGESEGKLITFGVKERYDVPTWVDYVLTHWGNETQIILDGLSMGSSTVMMASSLPLPPNVKGIIADCGYTSPAEIIGHVSEKTYKIKGSLAARVLSVLCRIVGGFSLYEASAPQALSQSDLPILFIHGKADDFVPAHMSLTNFEAARGSKRLCMVENAGHGISYLLDPDGIEDALREFVTKITTEEKTDSIP